MRNQKQEERDIMSDAISNLEVKSLGGFSSLRDEVQPEGCYNKKLARRKYKIMEQS